MKAKKNTQKKRRRKILKEEEIKRGAQKKCFHDVLCLSQPQRCWLVATSGEMQAWSVEMRLRKHGLGSDLRAGSMLGSYRRMDLRKESKVVSAIHVEWRAYVWILIKARFLPCRHRTVANHQKHCNRAGSTGPKEPVYWSHILRLNTTEAACGGQWREGLL